LHYWVLGELGGACLGLVSGSRVFGDWHEFLALRFEGWERCMMLRGLGGWNFPVFDLEILDVYLVLLISRVAELVEQRREIRVLGIFFGGGLLSLLFSHRDEGLGVGLHSRRGRCVAGMLRNERPGEAGLGCVR